MVTNSTGVSAQDLKSYIERVERLEDEKNDISEAIKEVFAEAKSSGFEPKIMKQIIKIRKMDKDDLDEQEYLLETYKSALGMASMVGFESETAHQAAKELEDA